VVRCAASFSCVTAEGGDSGGKGGGGVVGERSSSMGPRIGVVHGDVGRVKCGEHVGDVGCDEGGHGGVADGEARDGGEGVQEMDESTISPSNPSSLSSSTSHRRLAAFLVRFAGGGETGGDVACVGERVVTVGGASDSKGGGSIIGGAGGGRA
jgi:hypothetical protein